MTSEHTPTALLLEQVHPRCEELLEQAGISVRREDALPEDLPGDLLQDVSILAIRSRTTLTKQVLDAAPCLEVIGCFCIGTNQVDLQSARERGIAVFNAPFSNTRSVAEMTIALVIVLHRRLHDRCASMHAGHWQKSAADSYEVRGRTLGIVGYGHIGSQVSILAEAMGMRVIYFDIASRLPLGNARSCAGLDNLLEKADIVTLHVPETPETRRMIGGRELALMRQGAYLINTARGSVVDLEALAESLENEHLGGAGIDVYPTEPRERDCAFQCDLAGMSNVFLTPHIAGSTQESQDSIAEDVASKILLYKETGMTLDAVNVPEVGLPPPGAEQMRIMHFHENVPGVLGKLHTILADLAVNISAEFLQSDGDLSYVILDVDRGHEEETRKRLAAIPETIRMRTL